MKLQEVTGFNSRTATILNEGYQDLTEQQILYLGKWEKELWPLVEQYTKLAEQELTKQQVLDIFSGAEQVAMDSGDNKTVAGKVGAGAAAVAKLPVDIAKKVDAKINELGRLAQNAGPVKNADQKFEDLKKQITANNSDSKIVQGIQKISDWAKENPGKASIAVGVLTTMAAFAGGPAGGAAAGLILRASKDLLQGEKLSTAVGKSVKTAAYGALAGLAIKGLTDGMVDNIATGSEAEADALMDGFAADKFKSAVDSAASDAGFDAGVLDGAMDYSSSGNINGFYYNYDMTMTADQVSQYKALASAASSAETFSPEYYEAAGKLHGFLSTTQQANADLSALSDTIKNIPKEVWTGDQLDAAIAVLDNAEEAVQAVSAVGGAAGAAAQGALATVDDKNKEMHKIKPIDPDEKKQLELDLKGGSDATPVDKDFDKSQKLSDFGKVGETLSMEEKYELYLAEADPAQGELPLNNPNTLGAKLKRGAGNLAGKAAGAVKGAASSAAGAVKQTAKNVGNKVTADKLTKQWTKMGSPLDSGSIANILADAGMSNDQIQSIGSTQKVELEPSKPQQDPETQPDAPSTDTAQKGADSEQPSAKTPPAVKDAPIKKGTIMNKGGKDYEWAGALWVDTETNKPVGVQASFDMGLPNPKFTAILKAVKADPELGKLVKAQLTAKGVKPGTAQAGQAAQAGVKGTEKLKTA
jgi:hypothetical protein